MVTNDFSRSSFLSEKYKQDMAEIAIALQEESQEEREDRLNLVAHHWAHACVCFQQEALNQDPVTIPAVMAH